MPLANTINSRYDEMFTSLIYILITDNDDTKTTLKIPQIVSKQKEGTENFTRFCMNNSREIFTRMLSFILKHDLRLCNKITKYAINSKYMYNA